MIVEPTPTNPRSTLGRAVRAIGLATPVVLMVAFVGMGLAGPQPDAVEPVGSPRGDAATPAPTRTPDPAVRGDFAVGPPPEFPSVAADLAVRSVAQARGAILAGVDRPMAVAGWLGRIRATGECEAAIADSRGALGPLCEREARLVVADPSETDPGTHLHVRIPAGVRLPEAFERTGAADPVPVVIIGRAPGPDDPCAPDERGCGHRFTADRVTWAGGEAWEPGAVFEAGLQVAPPDIAYRGLDDARALANAWAGTILIEALVRPSTVAVIDAQAAAAMADGPEPQGLVWYVRALETADGPTRFPPGDAPPRLSWAVLDYETRRPLARGVVERPGEPPGSVAGLPVRSVADTIAARRAGTAPEVVAIAGHLRAWVDPQACTAPIDGLPGSGCEREAILADEPWSDRDRAIPQDLGVHLHGAVPPGVAIPDNAVGLPATEVGPPPPVVIIGRFGAVDAGCARDLRECDAPFTIEAVVWVSGQDLAVGRQVARGLRAALDDPVAASLGDPAAGPLDGATALLRAILADVGHLVTIDPVAAEALEAARNVRAEGAVWYLRGLDGETGAIRWAVLEPRTGRVLARG